MTATPPVRRTGRFADFGDIITSTGSRATIRNMLGGAGVTEWTQLFNPGHLAGAWDGPVEWVTILPGGACGEHLHDEREEIYYLAAGAAWMRIDGEERTVTAGDLITCPMGTRHAIGVRDDAPGPMTFLVIEMTPGRRPWEVHDVAQLNLTGAALRETQGYLDYQGPDDLLVATVNLADHLQGPWGTFTSMVVPAGGRIGPYWGWGGTAQITVILAGDAEVTHGQQTDKAPAGTALATVTPTSIGAIGDEDLRLVMARVTC